MTQECTIDKITRVLSELQSLLNEIPTSENNRHGMNNDEQAPSTKRQPPTVLSELQSLLNEIPTSEKGTTVSNDEEPPVRKEKPSRWVRLAEIFKIVSKVKKHEAGSESGSSRRSIEEDEAKADLVIQKLKTDVCQMKAAFENLTKFQNLMTLELGLPSNKLKAMMEKKDSIRSRSDDLKLIRNKIFDLKCQIPSLLYKRSSRGLSTTDPQTGEEKEINENGDDIYLPGLHVSQQHLKSWSAFGEVVEKFQGLDFTKKLCLLSFAVFPENREVKRTMLMYWWIGEDLISCDDSENPVTEILDEFSRKGLLEEVQDERKLKPTSYKMQPHVHSAVIYLAKYVDLFHLYGSDGKLIMKKSNKKKVCLVKGSSLQPDAKTSLMEPKTVKTVFNSSERYPDFTFKWFPKMEALKVLYLGRWERTAKRHIEVESTEFLKNMKALTNLRLASFQGISRIEKLEKSICALPKLVILDLRACYNLEVLPEDIGLLKNLIYLDVSECYMLDSMPKGISDLLTLQVLKGFVISQSDDEKNCAVKRLVNLKKLSITVNKYHFKVEHLMESLKDLNKLESLKIAWGASDKAILEERKKSDEVKAESDKFVDVEKKTSPSLQESTGTIQNNNKLDDQKGKSKVREEGDKGKADPEEGKKRDEVKADSGVEGAKNESTLLESTDASQNKPDGHQRGEKQEDKADGEKEKVNLEDRKINDESSKLDKVIEGVEKTNPEQESKDMDQSKPDDQKEKSKVQEKGDGEKNGVGLRKADEGESKTQKSEKKTKFGKKVSFSEEALIHKKPDDLKRADAVANEIHEMAPPSRLEKTAPKESESSKEKLLMRKGNETKRWGRKWDNPATHTSKLPSSLKKLELECFPEEKPPTWLNPNHLENLEKLSIRGGKLSKISEEPTSARNNWSVQILRLKYLHEFKAEWKELQALFPKMVLLEKYQCPKVAFCPTDGNGVWRSQPKVSLDMPK